MGFPAGGAVISLPTIFVQALIVLGFIRDLINTLIIGLLNLRPDQPDFSPEPYSTRPEPVPVSTIQNAPGGEIRKGGGRPRSRGGDAGELRGLLV